MNAALRENHAGAADISQNEPARMSGHRGFRQLGKLRIPNAVRGVRRRDEKVQPRTEDDSDLRVPVPQPIERRVGHDQAAEIGGADSGFRVPAITSGPIGSSPRIGVILTPCFGYAMRVWSIVISVKRKRSAMRFKSASVRSHSTSCPSAIRWLIKSVTSCSIFAGVGFSKLREALSIMSARLMMGLAFVCGFGPV